MKCHILHLIQGLAHCTETVTFTGEEQAPVPSAHLHHTELHCVMLYLAEIECLAMRDACHVLCYTKCLLTFASVLCSSSSCLEKNKMILLLLETPLC